MEEESFISPPPTRKSTKKKRRKHSSGDDSESDQEPERAPLADRNHQNRCEIRTKHDLDMAKRAPPPSGKRRRLAQKAAGRQQNSKEPPRNGEEMSAEEEASYRAKMRLQAQSVVKNMVVSDAMASAVKKCTNQELWKICKFFKNDNFLRKGTNFVMQKLELAELQGLDLKERIKKEEIWKELHAPVVRESLNKHRNYVCGEIQKLVYEALCKDQTADLPNKKEIKQLMTRDKLEEDTEPALKADMEAKFVTYVNVLLPKVAGNKYWGTGTRHYQLPSSSYHDICVPEGSGLDPTVEAVTASDEAFLVIVFENCYDKWEQQAAKYKKSVQDNQVDSRVEIFVPKTDKTDYNLPYTNSKAGNLKYGGWKAEGIKKFDEYTAKIEKNRQTDGKYLKEVEEENLVRIQKKEGLIEAADKDAKKKNKKGKSEAAFADVDAGEEDDFGCW